MAKSPSLNEVFRDLAEGLKSAALSPNIYGYKPHPLQKVFHSNTSWGRLFLGGNRSGKTVGGATESIYRLKGQHPYQHVPEPPVFGRAIAVDFINGVEKIIKPEIAKWLPPSDLINGSWSDSFDGYTRTLTLSNGSKLEFMSYDQDLDKFAGTNRDFAWFDEEPPKSIFNENRARLIDRAGKWWITMTPVEGMTWVYDDIYTKAPLDPNLFVVEIDMAENPYINKSERDMFLSALSDEEKQIRGEGKFIAVGGLIFKNFDNDNLLPEFWRPTPDEEYLWVRAMDHGFNNPTAWLFAVVDRDNNIYIFDEHYEREKVISYHARVVLEKEREHQAPEIHYSVGDPSIGNRNPSTGLSIQQEYTEFGIPILLGENDVQAGIEKTIRFFGGKFLNKATKEEITVPPRLFVAKSCTNFLYEVQRYRWGQWANKKVAELHDAKEEPVKKDDHAMDATRYLVASRPELSDPQRPFDVPARVVARRAGVEYSTSVYSEGLKDTYNPFQQQDDIDFNLGSEW